MALVASHVVRHIQTSGRAVTSTLSASIQIYHYNLSLIHSPEAGALDREGGIGEAAPAEGVRHG